MQINLPWTRYHFCDSTQMLDSVAKAINSDSICY